MDYPRHPRIRGDAPLLYRWSIDWPHVDSATGETIDLRVAKRQVEEALLQNGGIVPAHQRIPDRRESEGQEPPFQLSVEPLPNRACITVLQRPFPESRNGQPLHFVKMGNIDGLALSSAWNIILDELRSNHYKPTTLQKMCLGLSEESDVRLSVLSKLSLLSVLDHIRPLQQAIWAMSPEETYYWLAHAMDLVIAEGYRRCVSCIQRTEWKPPL